MKYVALVLCGLLLNACVAQKTQYDTLATQVEVIQYTPFQLQDVSQAQKSVSLFATDTNGIEHKGFEQIVQATLQGAGYKVTESPSQASYVVLIHVVHEGMLSHTQARAAAQQEYGKTWQGTSSVPQEQEESLGLAMVLDVHLAVREHVKPMRKNPTVVGTASTDTIKDESDRRLVVYAQGIPEEDDAAAAATVRKMLMQQASKLIVKEISL